MSITEPYTPMKCNSKAILQRNIERAKAEAKQRPPWCRDEALHGTLEVGVLKAAAEPVNTKEVAW